MTNATGFSTLAPLSDMQTVIIKSAVLTAAAAFAVAALVFASQPTYTGIRVGKADADYLDSQKCLACHSDHFASWRQTHHSRMTQEAKPETVQGDFTRDNSFEYLGVKAKMERRGDQFTMTLNFADGRRQVYAIGRTIGSRRMEQYVSRQGDQYVRLPLAYDLENRRWMSLNGSFFYPDGDNYFQHQAVWDQNCVFCHNVKAQPQMDTKARNKFSTEVAELGIACGACHGAAAAHAEAASSPLTRELWRVTDGDKQIVNPRKLAAERSMMVCGHCHGQRVPQPMERIQEILTKGDPFNAGDDLAKFYRPVTRETKIGEFSFASRFWQNGSPRLTAYEYQGLLRSACFTKGDHQNRINCLSCHSMHEGDIKGQIKPENRTDTACLSCHQQFAQPAQLTAHTGHKADSAGSPGIRCYDCHMPRVVYGVMAFHRTHDITIPNASLTASQFVPNACNQCHLDKSVNWAIGESKRLWPRRFGNAQPSSDDIFNQAEGARALFAGDALTRAMAAEALGKSGANWAAPFLIEALNDNYPIVRFFAANSLALTGQRLPKPDYLAADSVRLSAVEQWWARYPQMRQQVFSLATVLRARRINVDVEVGE
ncbi:MAG: multiheme c-type cytochrome [Blastocatellia bacterium]